VLRWFSLGIAASAGMQAAAAATRISKQMKYAVLSEDLTHPALGLALVLLFAWLGWGIGGAAAASVLSLMTGMGVALFFVRRLSPPSSAQPTPVGRLAKDLMGFSLTIFGSRFFITVITWIDRLVLGSFRPAAEVGIYQAAAQSSALFAIILGAFINILSPIAADLWHRSELARLQEVFRTSTKWGLYLSLPLVVVMWSAPHQILSVVFGPAYVRGAVPLMLLAGGQLINAATGGVGLLLSMTGHHVIWARTTGAMLGLDVLLNLFLVPRLGLVGAAIATSVTVSAVFLMGLYQVRRLLGMWPYDRRYLKGLAAAACSAGTAYLVGPWAAGGSWLGLGVLTLAVVAVFGGVLLVLGPEAEDREFLGLIRSRLGRAAGSSGADSR
jgi:O-antigen/teichoic acid export membrane protein